MSSENKRQAFRVPFNVQAELFYNGLVSPCLVINMSAGGMLVASELEIPPGSEATLGLRLFDELRAAAELDYISFQLEVLEVIEDPASDVTARQYRCRNLTNEGSPQYERARRIVFEAERQRLATASGASQASPMASSPERRDSLKTRSVQRYGKQSLNPNLRDQ